MDVIFVKKQCMLYHQLLQNAAQEKRKEGNSPSWIGNVPYLRLYHCLIDDNIREAYVNRDNVMSRLELDGRNSDSRLLTFYEKVSIKYNDPNFNPVSEELNDLHDDYTSPIDLCYSGAPTPTTPNKIKDVLTNCRAKLTIIIDNWERSGNGNGNRDARNDSDDGYGRLTEEQLMADDRRNFLPPGFKTHLLYFWHIMDKYDILGFSLSLLKKSCSASSDSVAETETLSEHRRKKRATSDEQKEAAETKKVRRNVDVNLTRIADVAVSKFIQECRCVVQKLEDELENSNLSNERRATITSRLITAHMDLVRAETNAAKDET